MTSSCSEVRKGQGLFPADIRCFIGINYLDLEEALTFGLWTVEFLNSIMALL